MMRQRRFVAVTVVLLSLPSLAGCFKATGGGKLTGATFGGSITTGFQFRCDDVGASGHVTGEVQYKDHGTGVAFHALIDQFLPQTCAESDQLLTVNGLQGTFSALGTYTPQPKNSGDGGVIQVTIQDQTNTIGMFGCNPLLGGVDSLTVTIGSGMYAGYTEGGCLEKGNFTVFPE
jgi:hypothetical protein